MRPTTPSEAITEGHPVLELRDEDREVLADAIAELLVAALEARNGTEPTR